MTSDLQVGLFRQPHSRIFSSFNHFVATDSNESKLDRIVSLRQPLATSS